MKALRELHTLLFTLGFNVFPTENLMQHSPLAMLARPINNACSSTLQSAASMVTGGTVKKSGTGYKAMKTTENACNLRLLATMHAEWQ